MAHHKKDKWLDTFCPEDACLTEEERVALPVEDEEIVQMESDVLPGRFL